MAREEFRVDLTADNEISDEARKAAKDLDAIPESVEVEITTDGARAERDIEGLLTKVDKLGSDAGTILLTSNATDIGREIADLVIDIDRLDATDPQVQIKADNIASLQGDLDTIEAKIKSINNAPVNVDTSPARDGVDRLSDSARGANSALANMIGNSAQDIGAVGGVAGSTGVAVGQMAEYFSDAALAGEGLGSAFKSMVAVAGPIIALAAVVQAVTGAIDAQQRRAEQAAQTTESFGDAMSSAADDAVGLADALRDNGAAMREFDASTSILGDFGTVLNDAGKAVPLLGALFQDTSVDIVAALSDAGESMYDFSGAIEGSEASRAKFIEDLGYFRDAGFITSDQYKALAQAVEEYGASADKARSAQALFNVGVEEANAVLDETIAKAKPLEQFTDLWETLFADLADGSIDAESSADAINQLAEALGLTQKEVLELAQSELDTQLEDQADAARDAADAAIEAREAWAEYASTVKSSGFQNADLEGGITAMRAYTDGLRALPQIAADTNAAFAGLSASVKENGLTFDVATEAGRANFDALDAVAEAVDTRLAAAYDAANGNIERFGQSAQTIADETLARLTTELGLNADQAQDLAARLGLLPADITSRYELAGIEEAKLKLDLLQTSIGALPPETQLRIGAAIAEGDFTGALAIAQGALSQGVVAALHADPSSAEDTVSDFEGGSYETTVDTDANTAPATSDVDGFRNKKRTTTILGVAELSTAARAVSSFVGARRTTTVAVDAYVRNVPSASSVSNRIGTVRVPVDFYIRHDARTDGSRGG